MREDRAGLGRRAWNAGSRSTQTRAARDRRRDHRRRDRRGARAARAGRDPAGPARACSARRGRGSRRDARPTQAVPALGPVPAARCPLIRSGPMSDLKDALERARGGGPERHHEKSRDQGKLPVRERVARLVDPDSFVEDALLANWEQEGFGADGVATGMAAIGGRPVALMANDPTVKAGSWGPKTVEKIIRVQEQALEHLVPMVYLVDSAGARITDQVQMFPRRRGAGRIFHPEVKLSGVVPQVCVLFGPSAAGGAYIPAFCDVTIMRDGNASMYLGSPRMAEMVIGEKVSLEEMDMAKRYLSYFPSNWTEPPPITVGAEPAADLPAIPEDENKPFDMQELIEALVDEESFLEVHKRWAKELIVGYGRLDGRVVGIVANQPKQKGGVLFVDSSDKAARFIWTCNAFNVPLL